MSIDLTPIVSPILAVVGLVIAGEIAIWVPKFLACGFRPAPASN